MAPEHRAHDVGQGACLARRRASGAGQSSWGHRGFRAVSWELARADPARLLRLLTNDPETEWAALLAGLRKAAAAAKGAAPLMRVLRRAKAEAALLIALADIGGVWPVARVTAALTEVADNALAASVRHLLGEAAKLGKLTPSDPGDPAAGSGYVVLAMGKMGGCELNYSSDIDLIVFFDPAAGALAPDVEPAPLFVRMTRELVKLLQERTEDGYVFRVDLRLRPDPASTQIAIATELRSTITKAAGRTGSAPR